jgi:hypothetical protein
MKTRHKLNTLNILVRSLVTKRAILLICLIFNIDLISQNDKWISEFSEDEKTEVVYTIYDSVNTKGKEVKYIEYTAKTKTKASLENCAAVFNNPDMHRKFYEYTEISEKVKEISYNEWIIYYYYSPPWPIADSDCVSRITFNENSTNDKFVFTSFSEPDLIEMKDVARSELNDITFTFTQINDKEVEILIEAILIPETSAPNWMMSAWFPEGPAGTLNRFKELAENL